MNFIKLNDHIIMRKYKNKFHTSVFAKKTPVRIDVLPNDYHNLSYVYYTRKKETHISLFLIIVFVTIRLHLTLFHNLFIQCRTDSYRY